MLKWTTGYIIWIRKLSKKLKNFLKISLDGLFFLCYNKRVPREENSIEKRKQERLFSKEKELQKTKKEFKKVLDELKEL